MEMLEECQTRRIPTAQPAPALEKRIAHLDPPDRKLLEFTLSGRLTRREAGLLLGRSAGAITRRLRTLLNRLHHPLVVALVDRGLLLPEYHRDVGLDYFLRRHPIRQIANTYALTPHAVRRILTYLRGWQTGTKTREATA